MLVKFQGSYYVFHEALVEVIHHYDDEILAQYDQGSIYLMKIDKRRDTMLSFPL